MANDQLIPDKVQLNEVPPPGFCSPGKSLIAEIERLREAVLLLCDVQRELVKKVDSLTLSPIVRRAVYTDVNV